MTVNPKEKMIAASILNANFLNLEQDLTRLKQAGITRIHFDVMDNHFVPNLSFGSKILEDVIIFCKKNVMLVDCHLMIEFNPKTSITETLAPFLQSGVNNITLHYEAISKEQIQEFLDLNITQQKGIALSPETSVTVLEPFLDQLDFVLLMSVNPGFGQQTFILETANKIKMLSELDPKQRLTIAVDGGINDVTASLCFDAGASYLVSGSYLLNSDDISAALKKIL